jgi:hypothetical protein
MAHPHVFEASAETSVVHELDNQLLLDRNMELTWLAQSNPGLIRLRKEVACVHFTDWNWMGIKTMNNYMAKFR